MRKTTKKPATKLVTVKSHVRKIKTSRSKALVIVKPAKVAAKPASRMNAKLIQRKPMALNDQVMLITGMATAHVALAVSSIAAIVTGETEKAFQFTALKEGGEFGFTCWLPKSALQPALSQGCYTIADWFLNGVNGYTKRWIGYNQRHNILAA